MRYTLWSRGRLLGETDLSYVRWKRRLRSGDVHPTPIGERLLLVACSPSAAMIELGRAQQRADASTGPAANSEETILRMPEYADWLAATVHSESLDLELRDARGTVIPTTSIHVQDTEFLFALARESEEEEGLDFEETDDEDVDPELEAAIEHDLAIIEQWRESRGWSFDADERPSWDNDEPRFPRFQVHVTLRDDRAVPW